jgi:hypothetical protein
MKERDVRIASLMYKIPMFGHVAGSFNGIAMTRIWFECE